MTTEPLFADIDKRLALEKGDSDSAYFIALSLKLEYMTKLVTAGVLACVGDDVGRHRYSIEHRLVRADSVGDWAHALNDLFTGPAAQFFHSAGKTIARDFTQRVGRGDWRYDAVESLREAALAVDAVPELGDRVSFRQFFEVGAQLRNRSRGHGAPTAAQRANACPLMAEALEIAISNMELFAIPWAYLYQNISGKYRVSRLTGDDSPFNYLRTNNNERYGHGVYIFLERPIEVRLVFSDPELHDILLPNGNHRGGSFETLSYATNDVSRVDGNEWSSAPGELPLSETQGHAVLEPFGETFANIPPQLRHYVRRDRIVDDVMGQLLDAERHPIVSLTGPGGIGKTMIAIAALEKLVVHQDVPYEVILWISARDIDLLESGAKSVKPGVITQKDIARAAVELLDPEKRDSKGFSASSYFEDCLANGAAGNTLYVLDNFETLQSPADAFSWMDAHVRAPNKVLITTRTRDFRGDYHIGIGGMTDAEANALVDQHSQRLGVTELITTEYRRELISESEGHPYVIRMMLGQVASESRLVTPRRIMAGADQLLRALFERTYNALTAGAQKVFLLLSSWHVLVPEVAVEAVLLRPETTRFAVADALDELERFSFVDRTQAEEGGELLVGVPLAASIYGSKKLKVSPFKVSVEEERDILMEFGASRGSDPRQPMLPRIENLYRAVAKRAQVKPEIFEERRPVLEFLAERVPRAFLQLSELVVELEATEEPLELAKYYLQRFLEIGPVGEKEDAWERLANLCRISGDAKGEIHALCEAALSAGTMDGHKLGVLANQLNNRLRSFKGSGNDDAWSQGVRELVGRVTEEMEKRVSELDATNCSRLAWLYLNLDNDDRAYEIAKRGIAVDPENEYCRNLTQRLRP